MHLFLSRNMAGSEREAHSMVVGQAAKETRKINLSLLCLVRTCVCLATSLRSC